MSKRETDADRALVLIVDDDERVRVAIQELVQSVGLEAACFASTQELLEAEAYERPGCLILDVRMPGLSGLDFQQQLNSSGKTKPIVFLTGHGDIPMTVQAMKAGAVDFLTKPVRDQSLLDAVRPAIERDVAQRAEADVVQQHLERFGHPHGARASGVAGSGEWPPQQADRVRPRHQRSHRKAAPQQRDAEDAGCLVGEPDPRLGDVALQKYEIREAH